MRPESIKKRDAALKPLWDLEDAGRPGTDPVLIAAARTAIAILERLLGSDTSRGNPIQTGVTWKYLGDAYWTLREADGRDALDHARNAYLSGETLLKAPGAELPLAKLNFNLANTLRLLDGARNRDNLLEARTRYNTALKLFQQYKPDAVDTVLEALRHLEIGLQASELYHRSKAELDRGRSLQERLRQAGSNPDPGLNRDLTAEIARMQHSQSKDLAGLASLLRATKPFIPGAEKTWEDTLSQVNSMMQDETGPSTSTKYSSEFDAAYSMLRKAAQSGEVAPERAQTLERVLQQFQDIVQRPATTPEEMSAQSMQMHEHLSRFRAVASNPTDPFSRVEAFVYDQMNRAGLGELETQTLWNFLLECGHIKFALSKAKTEAEIVELKRNRIRPLVHGLRQVALRHHLLLAEPFWGWSPVNAQPTRLFYAGSPDLWARINTLCEQRGLELAKPVSGWGAGQNRWNLMRSCGLAVFELRSAKDAPSVCHALGLALALSVQPMIVADRHGRLPFDIDIAAPATEDDLAEALDAALLELPQTGGRSELQHTVREALARSPGEDATTRLLKQSLSTGTTPDALQVEKSLAVLAERNGAGKWALLHPVWPGSYPSVLEPRCFHIMPFAPAFHPARDHVRRACAAFGVAYSRADEQAEPNVIRSIWEEICRATHVVVDISGLNSNVCLELGLAQATGRRTLIVSRNDGTVDRLFPEIAKLQVRVYDDEKSLASIVRDFVTTRGATAAGRNT